MSNKGKTYSAEFKREAVRLLEKGDKKVAVLARELGVARNKLYLWQGKIALHGDEAFDRKPGRPVGIAAENVRLKHELAVANEEILILKKAQAFFAKKHS
ncbi:MAG: transposase [bacterium]